MKQQSKLIICLCLLSSGLFVKAENTRQDSIPKFKGDTLKAPILYGELPQSRMVQAVGYLNGKKLESAPVTLLSNAFAGEMAGLYSQQTTGAPRYDNPTLSLRGKAPLIIIDGVPQYNMVSLTSSVITSGSPNQTLYDVLSINPEQIESVVLLKDALSTAMLGGQGMNGALMITTRKGGPENGSNLSITAEAGVQTPIGMRKALSAFDYATLYNEAAVNSGRAPVFSADQLNGYKKGSDANLYPNVDWKKAVLKQNAPTQRYNITDGGTYNNLRYFLSLDYQAQGGLLKEDPATSYGTNVDYKRYVFRSNIDIKLDKRLSASFNLLGNIQDYYQPGVGYGAVFNAITNTPANATPIYNFTGGSFAGTRQYPNNPYAQAVATGYLKDNMQTAAANISVKREMDDVIKGLFVKALVSYNAYYEQQTDRSKDYNAFYYPVVGDTSTHLRVNTIADQKNNSSVIERLQQAYAEVSVGFNREWKRNAITGLVMGRYDNTHTNNQLNNINQGVSGRVNYSWDSRFNLEAAGAYTGNNWFAPGNKYDFYPSAGASWNIDHEQFFKKLSAINDLKLRVSYGKVGNANPGYYVYNQYYTTGPNYVFGTGATNGPSVFQDDLANPHRVAEKANKLNIGFDLTYSHHRGWLNVDYYDNRESDLLQLRGDSTSVLGQVYPLQNIGKDRYYGVEVNAGWGDRIGKLRYTISGNFTTSASRVLYNDQPPVAYPWMAIAGRPVNQIRGYVADGFFSAGDLKSATFSGFSPSPGDTKYKDLNGDGVINQNDQTIIGNKKPLLFYGANLNLQFKGFDLNVLFQGVANRDILTAGDYEFPFANNGTGNAFVTSGPKPRVVLGTDVNNYIPSSSLFVRNGSFVRLKNAELGFNFAGKHLNAIKIKGIRIFVRGENLLTFSKYKESDPEDFTGLYPIQRIVTGGLSVKL